MLMDILFGGGEHSDLAARLTRVERKLDLVMNTLELEPEPHPAEVEVESLVLGGQKIEAIKRLRELTGCGLREAKEAVDRRAWAELLRWSRR